MDASALSTTLTGNRAVQTQNRQMSLRRLVLISGAIPLALLGALLATLWQGLQGAGQSIRQEHALVLPAVEAMADARFQIVQIQQFLTDVSATGDRDGFATADRYHAEALASLQRIATLVPATQAQAAAGRQLLDDFHAAGVRMANAYLTQGPDAGNAIMKEPKTGFDARALDLTELLQVMSRGTRAIGETATAATEASVRSTTLTSFGLGAAIAVLFLGTTGLLYRRLLGMLGGEPAAAVSIAHRIAEGDLSSAIQTHGNDTRSLMSALARMQQNLRQRIETDQARSREMQRITSALDKASTNMMVADRAGVLIYVNQAFDAMMRQAAADLRQALPRMDPTRLIGERFADFHPNPVEQQSHLVALTGTDVSQLRLGARTFKWIANPVVNERGERLGTVVEWIDRTSEVAAEAELDALLDAVTRGDFSPRLTLDGKQGFFLDIAKGMNNLTDIVSRALDDLAAVLKAVAQADLTKTIESRYEGRFAELKNDTNATVRQLEALVGRIREATDAINTRVVPLEQILVFE